MMRTTLNLPDDVFRIAKSLSGVKGISLGEAVAELVRQGFDRGIAVDDQKPFPCFVLPEQAKPITLEQTLDAEDDLGSPTCLISTY